jgi:hypothetical protein
LSSEDNSSEITSFSDFFASELFDNQSNNTQTSNTSTNEKISPKARKKNTPEVETSGDLNIDFDYQFNEKHAFHKWEKNLVKHYSHYIKGRKNNKVTNQICIDSGYLFGLTSKFNNERFLTLKHQSGKMLRMDGKNLFMVLI